MPELKNEVFGFAYCRCTRCVMPSTWQGIVFNSEGVCNICYEYDLQEKINWEERQKQLSYILDVYKVRARTKNNKWDCIVGLSGGKDSVYTLWAAKKKYSLRPLAVTFDHGIPMSADAEYNLQRIPALLDVDHLRFSIGRNLRNALCKHTSKIAGDWCYFCHTGVGSFPARVSKMFDIPLALWGEPTSLYQTTGDGYSVLNLEEQNKEHFERCFACGMTPEMMLPESYELRDLLPMTWPEGEFELKHLYLGNYEKWNQKEHVDIITKELGWKHIPTRISYVDWDKCDCVEGEELRDVQKFYRRRLSRVAFECSKEIREGSMTRKEAMEIVELYESEIPKLDVSWILNELGFESKEELLEMTKEI
jgi:N-acetyl sugar amidotransferase